jgi:glucosamine kinase
VYPKGRERMSDFFVGIDGGGSKCKVRVENSVGQLVGQAITGPANICLSVSAAWHAIYEGLDGIFKPLGMSWGQHNLHVCLGLAGLEIPEAKKTFLEYPHAFKYLHLTSDAHIACVGAHHGDDGAIIIIGTGVVGYQIQPNQSNQVSGWGFPHDDEGGGAWLGLEAIKLTFQWLDHRIEKSPLVEDIFAYFNHDRERLITWANEATSTDYAKLAPIIINHAQQEEVAALRLLKKAAHAIERVGHGLLKMQKDSENPLPCCLIGGVAPFIEPLLDEKFRARLVVRKDEPATGAILLMRKSRVETAHV